MAIGLSPNIERMIEHAIATGVFPSREAVPEAGVERPMRDEPLTAPREHLEAIETRPRPT